MCTVVFRRSAAIDAPALPFQAEFGLVQAGAVAAHEHDVDAAQNPSGACNASGRSWCPAAAHRASTCPLPSLRRCSPARAPANPPAAGWLPGMGLVLTAGWPSFWLDWSLLSKTCGAANQAQGRYQDDPLLLVHVALASRARRTGWHYSAFALSHLKRARRRGKAISSPALALISSLSPNDEGRELFRGSISPAPGYTPPAASDRHRCPAWRQR